jgi:hypothetical protein
VAPVLRGEAGSRMLMCGPCSIVQVAVKFDLKNKFQFRLKSNGSNDI